MNYGRSLPVLDCAGCLAPCCKELYLVEVDPSELNEFMQVCPTVPDPEVYILKRDGACHMRKCRIAARRSKFERGASE